MGYGCGVVGGLACIQEFSTDLIIMAFAKAFNKSTKFHTGGYYINSIIMGTSSLGWSSLRSSPFFIRRTSGVGLSTDSVFFFINDLLDSIKSSVCLFADDCVLYRNIHSLQDCLILQEDLDSFVLWGGQFANEV